ncbi:MAG: 4-hydroxy-tetrahydrodipicolinate synthase [Actinobacteria bacterium HGW-Actinobacteria-4]|nr:MAG: 4-hydroxy-tetrahydrodipicolinate synthase [Actinobacteria bacterium HGW-Actinobacteria-4]
MNPSTRPFGTLLTAMVTPLHLDGEIDFDAARRVASYLVDHGSDGLVLSGTTGEAPTTHAPEKVALIEAVKDEVGDRAFIVSGAGSNDTAHAVRMAEQAADAGADGILALTPYYSRPSQAGMIAHFDAIVEATDLPVMLYDIPGRTGLAITDASMDILAARETIVAVKDATGDIKQAKQRMERTGLAWYSGDDPLTLDFLRAGAVGAVSVASHAIGDVIRRMIDAHEAGDKKAADAAFEQSLPVIDAIMGAGIGAVMAKAAMHAMSVIDNRHMRLPHLAATHEEYHALIAALSAAGVPVRAIGE